MSTFAEFGYSTRNELSLRRVVPEIYTNPLSQLAAKDAEALLVKHFPLWVHNIISDPEFPQRRKLEMPLRRFEGELNDSKNNEVMAAVLSAGFKSKTLNPDKLPDSMPLRQRCAIVAHIDAWQEAYLCLEKDVVNILMTKLAELDNWIKLARSPGHEFIGMYSESA